MGIISIGGLNGYFTISEEDVERFFAAARRGWEGRREATGDTFQKYVEGKIAAQEDLARKMSDLFLEFADSNYLGDKP